MTYAQHTGEPQLAKSLMLTGIPTAARAGYCMGSVSLNDQRLQGAVDGHVVVTELRGATGKVGVQRQIRIAHHI